MSDDFGELKGASEIVKGFSGGSPLTVLQGLATFFGLETNATVVQRLVAHDYEWFVFELLLGVKNRLSNIESNIHRRLWALEEMIVERENGLGHLNALFEKWEERMGPQGARPSDLAAVLEAGFKVWKANAGHQKRELLGNALRNSFDPEQYQKGLTLYLMGILDELMYGDIHLLKAAQENMRFIRGVDKLEGSKLAPHLRGVSIGTLTEVHVARLNERHLIHSYEYSYPMPHGGTGNSKALVTTELGDRFLALVADQGKG